MREISQLPDKSKDIWTKATNHLSDYLDLKKGFMENEVVEVLGDTFKIIGFVRSTTSLIMQKRFESFLKGFNKNNVPTEEQIEKLIDYIDDESKAEFIADSLSKVMLARSSNACIIMGTLLNELIENKDDITHEMLVCIQSLSQFFDDDIRNFNFICNYIMNLSRGKGLTGQLSGRFFTNHIIDKGLNKESVNLTIEKAVSNQLLIRTNEVDLSISDDDPSIGSSADIEEYFSITVPGKSLNSHIIRCGLNI